MRLSLACHPKPKCEPNPKSGVIPGTGNRFLSSGMASLMACLRLVSEVQVHLAIAGETMSEARLG